MTLLKNDTGTLGLALEVMYAVRGGVATWTVALFACAIHCTGRWHGQLQLVPEAMCMRRQSMACVPSSVQSTFFKTLQLHAIAERPKHCSCHFMPLRTLGAGWAAPSLH